MSVTEKAGNRAEELTFFLYNGIMLKGENTKLLRIKPGYIQPKYKLRGNAYEKNSSCNGNRGSATSHPFK